MNLKESFRYQNFLESLMKSASSSIQIREHCFDVVKHHFKSKSNPDVLDMDETVENEDFYPNDNVIAFMEWLVTEREKLTKAIGKAKASLDFDLDAAIETNKFRQMVNVSIKSMLRNTPGKIIVQGRDYKFNVEGNQVAYVYDIEVENKDAFDRNNAKRIMRNMINKADEVSHDIDAAMINTEVPYAPCFDVNETFEDVMAEFIEGLKTSES